MILKNLPPLGPLVSFYCAAKHLSITKAAQELNVTHGAVSRAVKQVEDHFNFALFIRRNRRIYLTTQGRYLAEQVSEILFELDRVSEAVREMGKSQRFSISCEPTLCMRWLMPRYSVLNDMFPDLDIHISTAGGPIDLVAQNVDVALRRADFQWIESYWVTQLGYECIGPVCHPSYLKTLEAGEAVLLHTRTRADAWAKWQALQQRRMRSIGEKYFDHFYFSLQGATAGLGIAIASKSMVLDDIQQGILVAPYGFIETTDEYVALSVQNPDRKPELKALMSWLKLEL